MFIVPKSQWSSSIAMAMGTVYMLKLRVLRKKERESQEETGQRKYAIMISL
ncbi:hypothetical protein COLO4_11831 [Corchorus olitorius]|uniref:Uncharacterized protein n=1 Tax=Corchorus olitorius TaxID=93759 RepID=A0A1R3K335_9ROSI|nr:hypothetical protein COLO4_11831 [Corchorus olitorius]